MNFDMQNSTFTRTGSFRQQTLTEKLQDTTNVNNNVNNAPVTTPSNNTTSLPNIPANAVININNSNDYNRKGKQTVVVCFVRYCEHDVYVQLKMYFIEAGTGILHFQSHNYRNYCIVIG